MKVGQRLTIVFLVYAFLLFVLGYVFIINRQIIFKLYNKLSIEIIPGRIAIKNVKIKSRRMVSETYAFLATADIDRAMGMENEKAFQQAKNEEEEWEENYKRTVKDDIVALGLMKDIHVSEEAIKNFCQELFRSKENNQLDRKLIEKIRELGREEDNLFAIIDKAIEYDRQESEKEDLGIRYYFAASKRIFIILIGLSVFFVIGSGVLITRSITIPIKKIKNAMIEVGKERFETRVAIKANDELGFLAESFNKMANNLQLKVTSIINLKQEIDERIQAEEKLKVAYIQLRQVQAQLIQSAKMATVGQLASGVAHEINNPLTGVLNNIQMILENIKEGKCLDMAELKEILGETEESALRCKKIIQSLLEFSHISEGSLKSVSINEIAEKAITVIEHQVKFDNITIQRQFQSDLPQIKGDAQYLQQVFLNIIINAKEAIQERPGKDKGSIIIQTQYQPENNSALVSISDNGIGIPKELLQKIYDPFFTTKPVGKGTGLGLSIVHKIIKDHNGIIEVESQINKGVTFKITLPCV